MDPSDDPGIGTKFPWRAPLWLFLLIVAALFTAGGFVLGYQIGHEHGWKAGYDYGRPDSQHG